MKKAIILSLIIFFGILSNTTLAQTDNLNAEKGNPVLLYAGLGGGLNTRGGNFDLSVTLTSPEGMGGSINFLSGFIQIKDVPDDYYEGFGRTLTPADRLSALSFNFVKKFSTSKESFRICFEAGPSWVRGDLVELVINPKWPAILEYKYNKIHTIENSIGLSLALRADFPFTKFFGCDLSLFTNLNSVRSVVGLDFCFNLGMVRE